MTREAGEPPSLSILFCPVLRYRLQFTQNLGHYQHAMRYTQYRGLAQVTKWVRLKFAAMNLKKLAKWKWKDSISFIKSLVYAETPVLARAKTGVSRQAELELIRTYQLQF